MEFFKIRKDIPFMRHALVFNVISLITFFLAVIFLATKGLNFGVDFTGGTVMEVNYPHPADLEKIRSLVEQNGYTEVTVQNFGSSHDVLIRLPAKAGAAGSKVTEAVMAVLHGSDAEAKLRRAPTGNFAWKSPNAPPP